MARYRSGDRYLSEEEHEEEVNSLWIGSLFLFGAFISGVSSLSIIDPGWPKWIKLLIIILAAIFGGGILGALYRQIRILLGISIVGGILYGIGSLIWKIL